VIVADDGMSLEASAVAAFGEWEDWSNSRRPIKLSERVKSSVGTSSRGSSSTAIDEPLIKL
jgi:hypothetical protein